MYVFWSIVIGCLIWSSIYLHILEALICERLSRWRGVRYRSSLEWGWIVEHETDAAAEELRPWKSRFWVGAAKQVGQAAVRTPEYIIVFLVGWAFRVFFIGLYLIVFIKLGLLKWPWAY